MVSSSTGSDMNDSVAYINSGLLNAGASFSCSISESKGRILRVTDYVAPGQLLFQGPLLHKVAESLGNPVYDALTRLFHEDSTDSLDYSPMWYWCALNSLPFKISDFVEEISEDQFKQLKMLYHSRGQSASPTIRKVAEAIGRYLLQPLSESDLIELDILTVIWTLNCFEHSDDPVTYASFFLPSFMSHSCKPTAMWTSIGDVFFIRAQERMRVGDELTVSYLSEEFALRPIDKRRSHLQSTKFFSCDCPRCTAPGDDSRGFKIPARMGLANSCFLRYPEFSKCACGCESAVSLTASEFSDLISLEANLVNLVAVYDGGEEEDLIPLKPDPRLIESDEDALALEELIDSIGPFHWATARGLMQLCEYYRSLAMFPKAISFLKRRIETKRKYIRSSAPETSSTLAWALEDLGDIILLHVSGAVVAGLSEEARERFCEQWKPRSKEDLETLSFSGALEAYTECVEILNKVFGKLHEHTKSAQEKLDRLHTRLGHPII